MPKFTKEEQEKLIREWKEFCEKYEKEHKNETTNNNSKI